MEADQTEGRNFVSTIYNSLKHNRNNEIILSSAIGEKEKLNALLDRINLRMGSLIDFNIKSVETKRVEKNGFITVSYLIKIHVKYKNGESDEVFGMIKHGGDKIMIDGYNVYSDLLL